uniref:Uncharacterized protein n=1 Tax=Romanomermis culicivorax TaxID=13658 RepID=A0A915KZ98_ROMCU
MDGSYAPSRKTSIVISAPMDDNQGPFHRYRTQLPATMPDNSNVSTWSVLKTCIGKDLNKISFPIEMYEPLSLLQVLCEELQYAWLLDKAAETSDSCMRM